MLVKNTSLSPISLVLPGNPGQLVSQVLAVTCNADVSGSLNNRYFLLNEVSGPGAYVWFNVGGAGVDPGPFGASVPGLYGSNSMYRTSIQVSFAQNASGATIAAAIASALAPYSARWTASVASNVLSITYTVGGLVPNQSSVPGIDQGTGFSFVLSQLGGVNQQVVFLPGVVTPVVDSLAPAVQFAAQQNPALEIIFTGVALNCSFVVDHANGNGLGIRSYKGPAGISVYGYSSVPVSGNHVPSGFLQVLFSKSYSQYFGGFHGFVSPLSGSNVNAGSFTPGSVYVITSVGSTNWAAIGVPSNTTPVAGVAFIATGAGSGSGTAQLTSVSGVGHIEVVGDPNQSIDSLSGGGYLLSQYVSPTLTGGAFVSPYVATQPADNSVVGLTFYLG